MVPTEREIFIDVEPDIRIRYRRSEPPPPVSYAIVLETLEGGEWTTVRLWDNADVVDEHHEHEYTRAGGKQAPAVLEFSSPQRGDGGGNQESQDGGSGDRETMAGVMSYDANIDPATERVLAGIEDEGMAARYPNRAHFISADNPHQGEMATRALFDGDPVVIVYPDGHELLVQPEQAHGFARWSRAAAALLLRFKRLDQGTLQLPPRAHIEARDSGGHPIAA